MKPEWSTFGDRLRWSLDMAQRKRRELAKEIGVSEPAVTMVITGATKTMGAASAVRAARYLGVDELWLATGEGSPRPGGRSPIALRIAREFDVRVSDDARERAYAALMAILAAFDATSDLPPATDVPAAPTLAPRRVR